VLLLLLDDGLGLGDLEGLFDGLGLLDGLGLVLVLPAALGLGVPEAG
jgi:hypothetical protein